MRSQDKQVIKEIFIVKFVLEIENSKQNRKKYTKKFVLLILNTEIDIKIGNLISFLKKLS